MVKVRISYDRDGQNIARMLQAAVVRIGMVIRVKTQRTDKFDRIYIDIEDKPKKKSC